jgi:NifU-like protein involved in Fe-S cluster formation
MALILRRGTDADRQNFTPAEGELIYTTDSKLLYVGDGVTQGGNLVIASAGVTQINGQFGIVTLDSDDLAEGSVNLYHTEARVRAALSAGGDLSYNSTTGVISYTAPTFATVATSGSYNDLSNKPSIPSDISELTDTTGLLTSGSYNDLTDKPDLTVYQLAANAFSGNYADLSNKPTLFSGSYVDLTNKPDLTVYQLSANAFSGDYADLTNKPTLFSGNYADLNGLPTLFSGDYADLTGKPIIPTTLTDLGILDGSAGQVLKTTGTGSFTFDAVNYNDLSNKPTLFSGAYADLTGKPTLFSGDYADLTNKPTIPSLVGYATESFVNTRFSELVASAPTALDTLNELATALGNDPNFATTITTQLGSKANSADLSTVATTGAYNDLSGKPNLAIYQLAATAFSGDYADLAGKPTLFSGDYADLINAPTLFSGSYADLTNKPTIPGALNDLSDVNTSGATSGQALIWNGTAWIPATVDAGTAGGVTSVNGQTGPAVILATGNINESGSNLYFTNARADARVAAGITGKLNIAGGTMTGSLILADDPVDALEAATKQYVDDAVVAVEISSTDDLAEGVLNLYFKEARARASISASGSLSYDNTSGVISYTAPTVLSAFTNDTGFITSSGSITGNAATATTATTATTASKLATARTISLTGDVTGSVSFDGAANVSITTAVANDSHTHSFANLTSKPTTKAGYGITDVYTITQTDSAISTAIDGVLGGAGAAYDTLQEIKALMDAADQGLSDAINALSIGDATITIAAGSGLTTGGTFTTNATVNNTITLAHADTSSVSTVNNSGNTFIQDLGFDSFGHVTSVGSAENSIVVGSLVDQTETATSSYILFDGSGVGVTVENVTSGSIDQAKVTISHADTSSVASVNNSGNTFIQDLTFDGFGHVVFVASATATDTNTTYTAGSGLTLTGTTFAHSDTSTQGNVNNSGNTFIQDLTFDTYGHVTGVTSAAVGGFLTAESDTLASVTARGATTASSVTLGDLTVSSGSINLGSTWSIDASVHSATGYVYYTNASHQFTGNMTVNGALSVTGEITAFASDAQLKTNVETIADPMAKLQAIRGVTYEWNEQGKELGLDSAKHVGVIAQEVEAVMPELVVESAHEGYKTVKYDKLTALLIEAVKAQQVQIDAQNRMIEDLYSELMSWKTWPRLI